MKYLVAVLAAALVTTGVAFAAAKPLIFAQPLGGARLTKPFTVKVSKPGDLVVIQARVMPGGNFGWHSHRAAVAVAVLAGTLTLYDSGSAGCAPQPVTAGNGFVEQPGHVHLARNEGTKPVRLLVVYLGAPHGQSPDVPAAQPAPCASVK
jgi:quercetin dioxygenase-like cupin family protein